MSLALVAALALGATGELPAQTQIFYNARLALRARLPSDALRLWLLRNALRQQGVLGTHDEEFRSTVWAALGQLGLCPDGFPRDDEGGATLWPLALHNLVVVSVSRGDPPDQPPPFEAFEAGRQQRFISLHDVLDLEELRSVSFFATACSEPGRALFAAGLPAPGPMTDRLEFGLVLRSLLEQSLLLVSREKVTSLAVVETRLFDLNLELARLEEQRARQAALLAMEKAAAKGASKPALQQVRKQAEVWAPDSPQAAFLRKVLRWRADEWLALSRERRLALFFRARTWAPTPEARDAVALRLIDALIDRREGAEVEAWVSLMDVDAPRRLQLTDGDRGARLLELDASTGFKERGAIALARGVRALERGERRDALQSFALALKVAGDSREASATTSLARRWLSYVLGTFEANDELIASLKALVPPLEYNQVIEDLVWKAALRADRASFDRLVRSARHGGTFDARVALLQPLAQGQAGKVIDALIATAVDEPHAMLRFVNTLLEHIEGEELDVRRALVPLLKALGRALDAVSAQQNVSKGQLRRADELAQRTQALLAGLQALTESTATKARALAPGQPTFAGNVRLAPADALPWPFPVSEPAAPSPFRPLVLEPLEWRDPRGRLVFGWSVTE